MTPYVWVSLILIILIWFADLVFDSLMKNRVFKRFCSSRLAPKASSGRKPGADDSRLFKLRRKLAGGLIVVKKLTARYNKSLFEFYRHDLEDGDTKTFAIGLGFLKLFWIFMLANFFGSVLETFWCFLSIGHFEMRTSMVYGFFIPIYGFGGVMMSICLCRFYKYKTFWIFLGGAVIGAAVEYAASVFQEVFFKSRSWDYSDTPFNLDGRTNLMFALIWGVLGVAWVKLFYRILSIMIEKIPKKMGLILTVMLFTFFILDSGVTTAALYRQIERHKGHPATNVFEKYLDYNFHDGYLDWVYPHMRYIKK